MYIYEYAQTQTEQEATRRGGSFYFLLINLYEAAAKKIRVGRAEATDDVAQIRGDGGANNNEPPKRWPTTPEHRTSPYREAEGPHFLLGFLEK